MPIVMSYGGEQKHLKYEVARELAAGWCCDGLEDRQPVIA